MNFKLIKDEEIYTDDIIYYMEMLVNKGKNSFYSIYLGVDYLLKCKKSIDRMNKIFDYNIKEIEICI